MTRPVAGSTRSRHATAGQGAATQTAPSPAARAQVLPVGRENARVEFVAGSIRTSCAPPRPGYLSAHSAPSPNDSAEARIPILAVTRPVPGSARSMPAVSSAHRLPPPHATPAPGPPGADSNCLAPAGGGAVRSAAVTVGG